MKKTEVEPVDGVILYGVDASDSDSVLPIKVVGDAAKVYLAGSSLTDGILDTYNAEIYNAASGNGEVIAPTGLNRFRNWAFHVSGITVDTVNIQISFETDASLPDFMRVRDIGGAVVVATIAANGIYVPSFSSTNISGETIMFNSMLVGRAGATDTIKIRAIGRV